jgi:hypothetical protein
MASTSSKKANTSPRKKDSKPLEAAVFLKRAGGQSFEDFKKSVIEAMEKVGLLKKKDESKV